MKTLNGPVLVLAGAGTGKSRVLITRLVHILVTKRALPSEVLAVTFTNKAAMEMKERVEKLIRRSTETMWIGTFHSLCARILRKHAEIVSLKTNFTILDTDDQTRLIKQVMEIKNIVQNILCVVLSMHGYIACMSRVDRGTTNQNWNIVRLLL